MAISADMPEVPFGTVVGVDYMIVRPLKRGATGAVYVAEQLSTATNRALKILHPDYTRDETLYKRFEREAQVGSKIASEHVAQVIAAGVDRKLQLPWIAMELLEGQDLGDVVAEHGPIAPATVLQIFEQLCHALGRAHAIGIVHRDLKPANVFLTPSRNARGGTIVKVLDFGIARVTAENLTLSGAPLGTPSWMAPEQVLGDPATPASDVWALGLLAFYLLTGKSFWRAVARNAPKVELVREVCREPIPIASSRAIELEVMDKVPPGFDEWFALCVARVTDERFQTASAAFAALERTLR
jgi:eukaryotic-like serine/threonine-protein kinase